MLPAVYRTPAGWCMNWAMSTFIGANLRSWAEEAHATDLNPAKLQIGFPLIKAKSLGVALSGSRKVAISPLMKP